MGKFDVVAIGLAVLAIAGAAFWLGTQRGGETPVNQLAGEKSSQVGTIKVPEGPTIKVVFAGPPELKASWSEIGVVQGYPTQVRVIGRLMNVSQFPINTGPIVLKRDDGKEVAFVFGQTLNPGEDMSVSLSTSDFLPTTKQLMVEVKGIERSSSTGPNSIVVEPGQTKTIKVGGNVLYLIIPVPGTSIELVPNEFDKNGERPEEVLAKYVVLILRRDLSSAAKLCAPEFVEKAKKEGWWDTQRLEEEDIWLMGNPPRLVVAEKYLRVDGSVDINIGVETAYGTNGVLSAVLQKLNNEWRIVK